MEKKVIATLLLGVTALLLLGCVQQPAAPADGTGETSASDIGDAVDSVVISDDDLSDGSTIAMDEDLVSSETGSSVISESDEVNAGEMI